MELYCAKCGERIEIGAAYCRHCGASVQGRASTAPELDAAASSLAFGSLKLAKGFAAFLGYSIALSCAASAIGLVIAAAYLIYSFTRGSTVILPGFLVNAFTVRHISGIGLLFGGFGSILSAVLLFAAAVMLVQGIRAMWKRRRA